MKKEASTCCCLDYNGIIGQNLTEKLQGIYVTLIRMQYITRKISGHLPDILIVQPIVKAMLQVTGNLKKANSQSGMSINFSSESFEYAGTWHEFSIYIDEKAWMEHHIMMTNLANSNILSENPNMWCKVSLLNFVMSNNFGYFNMC